MSPQPVTILHAIDTTGPGGAETVFLQLAQTLNFPGVRNLALIKGPGWVEDQLIARQIPYLTLKPFGWLSLPYYWHLVKILHRHNVRLIQANLLGSTLTFAIVSLLLRIPLVATLHGRVDVNPNERWMTIKKWIMKCGVDQLIAVSDDLSRYIGQRQLADPTAVAVIYNGINTSDYGRTPSQSLRQLLQLDDDAILIGSVGNVRPAKAYDILIDCAAIVVKQLPNAHFVVAGHQKPKLMKLLNEQIQRLNLGGNVHFVGYQQPSAVFLGQLNIFALSSSSEGFSIATIEAMATGLPVVATRCGGPEEIIEPDKTGLLVPSGNPQALAEAIMKLHSDPGLALRLAKAAKDCTSERFSSSVMLDRYTEIYQRLCSELRPQ